MTTKKIELYNSVYALAVGVQEYVQNGYILSEETPAVQFGYSYQVVFVKKPVVKEETKTITKSSQNKTNK